MNTPWWFRLYTVHTLKFFGKITVAQFALYFILNMLGGTAAMFSGLIVFLAPIAYVLNHKTNHFRSNIEFHKMSIPFPKLKRAFFFDIAIKQAVFSGLFLLNLYIAIRVSGGMKLASEFIFFTPSQLIYYVPVYFLGSASVMTFYNETKYVFIQKHRLPVVNFTLFMLFISACGVAFASMTTLGYQVPMILGFALSGYSTGVLFFRSKAIFHQFRPVGRIRDAFKFSAIGMAITCCFYLVAVMFGRHDVLETKYSANQRASSLSFSGPFTPSIDKETFVTVERVIDPQEAALLYQNADFPVASLGVEYFLDNDPQSTRLRLMLSHSKPETTFLSALYDHFEKYPEYWKEKHGPLTFKAYAYSLWPAKALPEKYELARVTTENEIKEKMEERKRKREIASKKRSR